MRNITHPRNHIYVGSLCCFNAKRCLLKVIVLIVLQSRSIVCVENVDKLLRGQLLVLKFLRCPCVRDCVNADT